MGAFKRGGSGVGSSFQTPSSYKVRVIPVVTFLTPLP